MQQQRSRKKTTKLMQQYSQQANKPRKTRPLAASQSGIIIIADDWYKIRIGCGRTSKVERAERGAESKADRINPSLVNASHPSFRSHLHPRLFIFKESDRIDQRKYIPWTNRFQPRILRRVSKNKNPTVVQNLKEVWNLSLSQSKLKLGPVHGRNHIVTYDKFSTRNTAKRETFA